MTNTTITSPSDEADPGVLEATGNLAAGDLDGDGHNEIVGAGAYAGTYAYRSDGSLMWEAATPTAVDRGLRYERSIGTAPTIADLNGDGHPDVIVGHNVIDGTTGTPLWTGNTDTGKGINTFLGPIACVADLDGDGSDEVIAGPTAFHADGSIYWNDFGSVPDGLCAVADIWPSRPGPEVVLVSAGYVRILDGHTGEVLWVDALVGRVDLALGGAPTVADFNGDGHLEIGVANGNEYGVYDPLCTGADMPHGCEARGLLWSSPTSDASSSGTGSSVFDFNGDGRAEVVYNDEHYFRIYDGVTGNVLFQRHNSSRTRTENPTIADVNNDGNADIIFSANAEAYFLRDWYTDPGVEVWGDARGRWVEARRIWNEHAYHITNVDENGHIPAHEAATFTSYRQNEREGGDVLAAPDLWGGHGSFTCLGSGRARLTVNVQNWGLERAGAGIVVAFYRGDPQHGGMRMGEATTTTGLAPRGGSEQVTFDAMLGPDVQSWYAVLDSPDDGRSGGAVDECHENNNEVLIWQPSCP